MAYEPVIEGNFDRMCLLDKATKRFVLKFSKYVGILDYTMVREKNIMDIVAAESSDKVTSNLTIPSKYLKPTGEGDSDALTIMYKTDMHDNIECIFDGNALFN